MRKSEKSAAKHLLTRSGRTSVAFYLKLQQCPWKMVSAGVYHRMEADDFTQAFKNKMQIHLEGSRAVWRTSRRGPISLPVQWLDDASFAVDWEPVCSHWGRGVFRSHVHMGVEGLLEDDTKFWKYAASRAGDTSRSPRWRCSWPRTGSSMLPVHEPPGTIPKVFYINLARRDDRRAEIVEELSTLEIDPGHITRIEAIDAQACSETALECCARSHIAALDAAIMENLEEALILEDDFQFSFAALDTRARWAHFVQQVPHYDIVSWAHNCLRPLGRGGEGHVRVRYLQTAAAYVVRRSAMQQLRDIYEVALVRQRPFDTHMTSISWHVQWYAMTPALGIQRPSFSDILQRHVAYGC